MRKRNLKIFSANYRNSKQKNNKQNLNLHYTKKFSLCSKTNIEKYLFKLVVID